MSTKNRMSFAIRAALGLGAPALLSPALSYAQDEGILEEVHVTGTRIQKANMVSASPITQVNSEDLLLSGITRVEDLLKNLPQVSSEQSSTNSNGSTGTATIDLRYLGAQRTLVLVDGRRLAQGSPFTAGAADINQIPGALIERVEVLTGGASATYGSDALAGVVNFFMVDDFEGLKLDYQFGQYSHDNSNGMMEGLMAEAGYSPPSGTSRDGDVSEIALIMGGNLEGGRGNVTAYVTYREIDPVVQRDRIHSACSLSGGEGAYYCGGSAANARGRFTDFGLLPAIFGVPTHNFTVSGNEFVEWDNDLYNYGDTNYFQRPDERWTAGAMGHYAINNHVEAYTQLMFTDDRTVAQIAASGLFWSVNSIACNNPLLSEQQFDALCGAYGLGPEDSGHLFAWDGKRIPF